MHHLSHLTNDYVNLWKGRAPSSTLKVPFHTFSSGCYYNRPEVVGALRRGGGSFSIYLQHRSFSAPPPQLALEPFDDGFEFGNKNLLRERKMYDLTATKQNMFYQ